MAADKKRPIPIIKPALRAIAQAQATPVTNDLREVVLGTLLDALLKTDRNFIRAVAREANGTEGGLAHLVIASTLTHVGTPEAVKQKTAERLSTIFECAARKFEERPPALRYYFTAKHIIGAARAFNGSSQAQEQDTHIVDLYKTDPFVMLRTANEIYLHILQEFERKNGFTLENAYSERENTFLQDFCHYTRRYFEHPQSMRGEPSALELGVDWLTDISCYSTHFINFVQKTPGRFNVSGTIMPAARALKDYVAPFGPYDPPEEEPRAGNDGTLVPCEELERLRAANRRHRHHRF